MSAGLMKPLLFEIAWEVARKTGGIYTVLKSKSPSTVVDWGDRYCLVGPYDPKSAEKELEPLEPGPVLRDVMSTLEQERGMKMVFGRWLIPGYPRVLLIDFHTKWSELEGMKKELYETHGIPSPMGDGDPETNEVILFGFQVFWFLEEFCAQNGDRTIIAQFHEWMAAVALPLLRHANVATATIFTTHATLLGRYMCAGQTDFYANLSSLDVDYEAGTRGIFHRHSIEKKAAHVCHVLTTVSEITGLEAEHILGRKPDVILPNGLQISRFTAMHEFQNLHLKAKLQIHEFLRGHFYGFTEDIDLDNALCFFTAGRYEYTNKGYDMFIEAMARLNHRLKAEGSEMTVFAFLITRAKTLSYNVETLQGQSLIRETRKLCNKITEEMGARVFDSLCSGQMVDPQELISDQERVLMKQRLLSLQRDSLPPITTHTMVDDAGDPILNQLRQCQLFNNVDDRVKIVYHPAFLNASSAILPMDYEEFVRGTNLGVFPSYYEPWGYTPAECTVLGIPSVTSNLAGFANYIERHVDDPASNGLWVVDRQFKSAEESMEQLVDVLHQFCHFSRRERIMMRNRVEKLSDILDWSALSRHYEEARGMAVLRFYQEQAQQ